MEESCSSDWLTITGASNLLQQRTMAISFFQPNNCTILPCCECRLSGSKIFLFRPIFRCSWAFYAQSSLGVVLSWSSVRRKELSECHGDCYTAFFNLCASSPRLTPLCQTLLRPSTQAVSKNSEYVGSSLVCDFIITLPRLVALV